MTEIRYHGFRTNDDTANVVVMIDRQVKPLPLRLDLCNHSPTGFEWGYGGSGPAQLALAILSHALGDDARAVRLHQRFKWRVIGALARNHEWWLTAENVRKTADEIEAHVDA